MVEGSSARIDTLERREATPLFGGRSDTPILVWAGHSVLLLLILGSMMLMIGRGVYTIDEAAYRFQARIAEQGEWGLPYPTDQMVEQTVGAPLTNSELGRESWYPAARHPAYVQVIGSAERLLGFYGPILFSIVGVLMAAIGIERISRWLGGIPPWLGFWATGLAGPAAFHGMLAWAHAPALGQMAIGLSTLLVAHPSNRQGALVGAAGVAGSVLLRGDAPIMVAGIVAALAVASRQQRHYLRLAILVASTSAMALGISRMWHDGVVDPSATSGAGSGRSVDLGRYAHTAFEIILSPGISGVGTLRVVSVLLFAVAIGWLRRHREEGLPVARVLAFVAAAAAVIGSIEIASYGALLPAFPLLAVGLPAIGFGLDKPEKRRNGPDPSDRREKHLVLAIAAVIGICGPIVASVSGGGGLGWGGRYVLLSMVAVIPLTVSGCASLWKQAGTRPLLVAALVATAAVQVSGARTLYAYHRLSLTATEAIATTLPSLSSEMDLIIAVDARIGRLAPEQASVAPLVSAADEAAAHELLAAAEAGGLDRVAIVSYEHEVTIEVPDPWRRLEYRNAPVQVLVVTR